jgi:hypothetical protein
MTGTGQRNGKLVEKNTCKTIINLIAKESVIVVENQKMR